MNGKQFTFVVVVAVILIYHANRQTALLEQIAANRDKSVVAIPSTLSAQRPDSAILVDSTGTTSTNASILTISSQIDALNSKLDAVSTGINTKLDTAEKAHQYIYTAEKSNADGISHTNDGIANLLSGMDTLVQHAASETLRGH